MLAHLAAHNWVAWEDVDADTAKALHALLSDSAPSSTVAEHSGADTAAGEGVPSEERRACWTCRYDSLGGYGLCTAPPERTDVTEWIRRNCPDDGLGPLQMARNCPGWAPKSGEVSRG